MGLLDPSDTALSAIVGSINTSTPTWQMGPLPAEWIFVNGSLPVGSNVNGYNYDGSSTSISATVIQVKQLGGFGSLPLNSFVYLMISIGVVLALLVLPNCRYITKLLLGDDNRFGTDRTSASMSEYAFDRHLREIYPAAPTEPLPSYPEVVDYLPEKEVNATEIRDCQSTIRKIYALKVDAYNARDVRTANLDIVAGWKMQASAGLRDVKRTVDKWAQKQDWSDEERVKVNDIRQRILAIQPDMQLATEGQGGNMSRTVF